MRRGLFLGIAMVGSALVSSHDAQAKPATILQLLTGFSAKEACSCVFVVGQTDQLCTAFGQQPGLTVTVTIDHNARTVTSTFTVSTRTARAGDNGCVLDPLP